MEKNVSAMTISQILNSLQNALMTETVREMYFKELIQRAKELEQLVEVGNSHVLRYQNRDQYWDGRRDEAGWFRDKLNALLKVRE